MYNFVPTYAPDYVWCAAHQSLTRDDKHECDEPDFERVLGYQWNPAGQMWSLLRDAPLQEAGDLPNKGPEYIYCAGHQSVTTFDEHWCAGANYRRVVGVLWDEQHRFWRPIDESVLRP